MLLLLKHLFQGKKFNNLAYSEFDSKFKTAQKPILIDVRSKSEYQRERIPNALHIDINSPNFRKRIQYLRKKPCFVYCKSGMRSSKACHIMLDMEFENINNLKGGIRAWEGRTV